MLAHAKKLCYNHADKFLLCRCKMFRKFIGDRAFYRRVLALMIPIMLQNGITNLVNMLDNIMIGRIGTVEMTGVAVTNQLLFVFNLCIFGAVSGAGIFTAQYHGSKNEEGVRQTFRFKLIFCCALALIGTGIFIVFGDELIGSYLKGEGSPEDIAASLHYAKEYMWIMLIGLVPYTIVQCYSSTLRETDRALPPMVAGVAAVFVNLVLNYMLIFGNFGAPALGVRGAAIATVISRFAELGIIFIWTKIKKDLAPFARGALASLYVPAALIKNIMKRGMPLMVNEAMWASGIAVLNQCYSVHGLDIVSAHNIQATFFNVFSVVFMSVGVAAGIILGQILGSDDKDLAIDTARKLIFFSVVISIAVGAVYFVCASFIPEMYNTTTEVKAIAAAMMKISALAMPLDAFAHASYFTLRSGGKAFITILFDSCFVWAVSVPIAFLLGEFTQLPVLTIFAVCHFSNILKDILGYIFVKRGIWVKNIVKEG